MRPIIATITGDFFNVQEPQLSVVNIEQIAHALSNICRYTGHCREFYSVAQHSVLVSYLVPAPLALYGLLHDASEAFIGDVASPLKNILPEYKAIEDRVERHVLGQFGLSPPMPPEVKAADTIALATERRDLMPPCGEIWDFLKDVQPHPCEIVPKLPMSAKAIFLARYDLIKARHGEG